MKRRFLLTTCLFILGFGVVGALPAPSMDAQEEAKASVTVYPDTLRVIDGKSFLERGKYISLASANFYDIEHEPGLGDYLLYDLNISAGRDFGHLRYLTGRIDEDKNRPGYADLASIAALPLKYDIAADHPYRVAFGESMDLILHGRGISPEKFPDWMEKEEDPNLMGLPKNLQAAAEYLVAGLEARYTDFTRPRYYELFNEPSWQIWSYEQFRELHALVAQEVRRRGLDVLVGGPCISVAYWFRRDYTCGCWTQGIKGFVDQVGKDIDFVGFHIYDFYRGSLQNKNITTGLPLENVLDLLAAYTKRELGRILPIAVSEMGGYDLNSHAFDLENTVPPQVERWMHMNALNNLTMTFLDRPTTVLKAAPFIFVGPTGDWDPQDYSALYTDKNGVIERTENFMFYQLWKDVSGSRVRAHSDDPDLQVRSFIDGTEVYLVVNNLASAPKSVDVAVHAAPPTNISASRFFFQTDGPVFEEDVTLTWDDLASLQLEENETVVVTLTYAEPLVLQQAVNENTFYSEQVIVPITSRRPQRFTVEISEVEAPAYAYLRIGISRPHELSWTPTVTMNGHELFVPNAASDEKQLASPEYATSKIIAVPTDILQPTNTVTVQFPDNGGAIGAVGLVVAEPISLEQHYETSILPGEFVLNEILQTPVDPSDLTLSWQPASGADAYQVQIASDPGFSQVIVDKTTTETALHVPTLAYGGTYYWQVRGISLRETGNGAWQRLNVDGPQSFSTEAVAHAPETPDLQVSDGLGQVSLHWSPATGADEYRVYRRQVGESEYTLVATGLSRIQQSFLDREVTAGTSYEYAVTAVNGVGESERTDGVEVFVRQLFVLLGGDGFLQEDRWQRSGAWTETDEGALNLRALFPRAFGSLSADDVLSDSTQIHLGLVINEVGNEQMAVLRLSLHSSGRSRYQLLYWYERGAWELQKRTEQGGQLLAQSTRGHSLRPGFEHQLVFSNRRGQLQLLVDGELVLEVDDLEPLTGGGFELFVNNLDIAFAPLSILGHQ